MKYLSGGLSLVVTVLVLAKVAPTTANVIFSDDFNVDGNPVPSPADVGTWHASSSAFVDSGYLVTYGPAGDNVDDRAFGVATQTSPAGTELLYEWDWNLLSNDNDGTQYRPIAGLAHNGTDRALGLWVRYVGSASNPPTTGDLVYEAPGENWTDTEIDVPVGNGFQSWSIEYTVGDANALLSLDGFAPVTDLSIAVAVPSATITGPWMLGNGDTNSRWDNPTLTVIPEPATAALLGLAVVLLMRRRRA